MKNSIFTSLLFLVSISAFAQNSGYEYAGRLTPSVKKEKLDEVSFISQITPEFWRSLSLSSERSELEERRKTHGYYNYNTLIDYVSVEVSTISNGKILTSQSTSDKLTPEQKNILSTVDLGTDIRIKVKFKYKFPANGNRKIIEGVLAVTAVPQTEAEYAGGFKQLTAYLTENFLNKIPGAGNSGKIRQAIVNFTVNEEGRIVDVRMARTSTDPEIDKLLLDAIRKMPRWRPAENSGGIKVKQEFSIPFGGDGC